MITEITIKLPLIKRWILKALIGGLLKNLDKSREFYRDGEKRKEDHSKAAHMYCNQKRGIEQSINHVRVYCGLQKRDFVMEDWLIEMDKEDIEKKQK